MLYNINVEGENMYDLKKDDEYVVKNIDKLLKEHENEFALVHNCEIQGFYSTREEALDYTKGKYELGEFIIKEIVKDNGIPKFISFRSVFQ